ncbi:hypothetical protein HDV05_003990 [Chytridiales sp. JEL 0842]|nr:hypothetical protein HDV05_003990 [Chytridiales sp. JEL 0842]
MNHLLLLSILTSSLLQTALLIQAAPQAPSATTASPTTATGTGITLPTITGLGVPPQGKVILGAWLNYEEFPPDLQTPSDWNRRLGFKTGSFQHRQSVPPIVKDGKNVTVTADLFDDDSNASIFLTVYADQVRDGRSDLDLVDDYELTALAQQLDTLHKQTSRQIFLRWCPEQNGEWMLYGGKPAQYVEVWLRLSQTIKRIAPHVALVWSPNFDLNNRGDHQGGQPYFPGPEHVDWVGTSQYWKPSQSAISSGGDFLGNIPAPPNYFSDAIQYVYSTYSAPYSKPFVISEASASFEAPLDGSIPPPPPKSQAEFQYDYWTQIFESMVSGRFPNFKMVHVFEYEKPEDGYMRDFRVTWDAATVARFRDSMQVLIENNLIEWAMDGAAVRANATTTLRASPTATAPTSATASVTKTSGANVGKGVPSAVGLGFIWAMVLDSQWQDNTKPSFGGVKSPLSSAIRTPHRSQGPTHPNYRVMKLASILFPSLTLFAAYAHSFVVASPILAQDIQGGGNVASAPLKNVIQGGENVGRRAVDIQGGENVASAPLKNVIQGGENVGR